jgi:hypothetical protein
VDHSFSSPKRDLVTEARTDGISDPVILVLDVECPQARAIYRAIHGSPMPAEQIGPGTFGAIEKLSRPRLSTTYGGIAAGQGNSSRLCYSGRFRPSTARWCWWTR